VDQSEDELRPFKTLKGTVHVPLDRAKLEA
jgi:hypothetical protein